MYLAHSGTKRGGPPEPLKEHLARVAARAAEYAAIFGAAREAETAGVLHDLGKYSELFLRRLRNEVGGLDHWSLGACAALACRQWRALAAAIAIQGHHTGLQLGSTSALRQSLNPVWLKKSHPWGLQLTEQDHRVLLQRLQDDGLSLPSEPVQSIYDPASPPIAGMLDVRMLFSALVDADYIETEAHFQGEADGTKRYRTAGPPLEPEQALCLLRDDLDRLRRSSRSAERVNRLRDDVLTACLKAAEHPLGLFTLSAPTGSGKTLAMLAFALRHAVEHSLRRIIMVIPYLTIIEQTARTYREIFQPHFGEHYVLEDHSLTGMCERRGGSVSEQDNEDSARRTAELLAKNWDAPLVITTSVQCLESLFSNRPSACRKLHRLAGSVILFDEVQTLPPRLAVPTLAALSRLAERYGASVVFSTATQPAFAHLDATVREYTPCGWQPQEIVPSRQAIFNRSRRAHVHWDTEQARYWDGLAGELAHRDNEQVLCIVNLKRHAVRLVELMREANTPDIFHLSTNMCPAHREKVLNAVRSRLEPTTPQPCRLISTQCVEAGVDLDFPVVYRALGPLEAIAQAAGRCNRNGNLSGAGHVRVFRPESDGKDHYPQGGYRQAAGVTETLLNKLGPSGMDINDPHLFERYYSTLYDLVDSAGIPVELDDALQRRDFVETAQFYRIIDQNTINVVVPYNMRAYEELRKRLEDDSRLTRAWIKQARPYTVSLFRPRDDDTVRHFLNPVPLGRHADSEDWYFYLEPTHYDDVLGLKPPLSDDLWIA